HLLLNPDYEEEIKKTEKLLSLELSMNFLTKIEYAIYALGKNLNINLLVSSIFSSLVEWRYA
ncbi:MAG: DNA polymerase III subunit delta', partial [Candidatus Aminicenantes bacterium]|nr:DNA polymerase III subunit delta' [Candidatus Aminicenantes bacterium]